MPHDDKFILFANATFSPFDDADFNPEDLLGTLSDATDIDEGAEALGLYAVLSPADAALLRDFLAAIPPSMHAAALGAVRSALSRGLRTQFTWHPGYEHELRMWEVSDKDTGGWRGMVNLVLTTPHPPEEALT